jgi:hypothetical protein
MSIEKLQDAWNNNRDRRRAREREQREYERCMQAHRDLANGTITQAQCEEFLRDDGERAWQVAIRERRLVEERLYTEVIEPAFNDDRRDLVDQRDAALAKAVRLNGELVELERAVSTTLPKDFARRPASCVHPDLTDVWLVEHRLRAERVLTEPQRRRDDQQRAIQKQREAQAPYRPGPTVAIVAAASGPIE